MCHYKVLRTDKGPILNDRSERRADCLCFTFKMVVVVIIGCTRKIRGYPVYLLNDAGGDDNDYTDHDGGIAMA